MDLSLWDAPDDQAAKQSTEEDDRKFNYSLGYGRDMIEENALNEKYCVQVLRKLIEKADEDIIELEEDIVMLKCQLAWVHEDWSKSCSFFLEQEIDCLNVLIHAPASSVRLIHLPKRLHDFLKPLHESFVSGTMPSLVARKKEVKAKKRIDFVDDKSEEKKTEHHWKQLAAERNTIEKAGHRFTHENRVANSYQQPRKTEAMNSSGVEAPDIIMGSQLNQQNHHRFYQAPDIIMGSQLNQQNQHRFYQPPDIIMGSQLNQQNHHRFYQAPDKIMGSQLNQQNHHRFYQAPDIIMGSQLNQQNHNRFYQAPDIIMGSQLNQQITEDSSKKQKTGAIKEKRRIDFVDDKSEEKKTEHWKQQAPDVIMGSQLNQQITEDSSKKQKTGDIKEKGFSRRPFVKVINTKDALQATETKDKKEIQPYKSLRYIKYPYQVTLAELHSMARERNLQGYRKLKKEDLMKQLGFQSPDSPK